MNGFEADLDQLAAAAQAVRAAANPAVSELATARLDVWATGSAEASAALDEFCRAWQTGIDALMTDLARAADVLAKTALSYDEADLTARQPFLVALTRR